MVESERRTAARRQPQCSAAMKRYSVLLTSSLPPPRIVVLAAVLAAFSLLLGISPPTAAAAAAGGGGPPHHHYLGSSETGRQRQRSGGSRRRRRWGTARRSHYYEADYEMGGVEGRRSDAIFDDDRPSDDDREGAGSSSSEKRGVRWLGTARGLEFSIFETRGGRNPPPPRPSNVGAAASPHHKRKSGWAGGRRSGSFDTAMPPDGGVRSEGGGVRDALRSIRDKLPSLPGLPGIQLRIDPTTTLKLRKTLRPLGATVFRLGAAFNAQLGVWQFRSSWEDRIIGGTLSMVGRELQISKTWRLSIDKSKIGAYEDLVTSIKFRAAVDLGTLKAYARFGFRTERISPLNVYDGFTLTRQFPLDGENERIKLEVKANMALPEPEIEYSTENRQTLVGLGDIEVNIDELNILLDY